MKRKYWLSLAALTWFVISTILLTLPGKDIPTEGWFAKFLEKIWIDKWVHVGLFGILAFLICISWRSIREGTSSQQLRKNFLVIGAFCLIYGIIMEFVQLYFIADRSFDMMDIIADGAGAALGAVFSIWRYIKK